MYSREFLDHLRDTAELSAIIGRRLPLKKAGHEHKACCPFHQEATPSFTVNDDKGFFHCFGCGAHGDAVEFVARWGNLSFGDAVEAVAAEAGVALPDVPPEERARQRDEEARRRDLLAVVERATAWFEQRLAGEEGAAARAYLAGRGLTGETIARFRLGWAPDDFDALRRHLAGEGVSERDAVDAGLLKPGRREEDGREHAPYSRFRGRVTFPVGDHTGRVVGFSARRIDGEKDAKYINSPAGPLFDKGRLLYGLSRARRAAREGFPVVVVEGVLDVVQLVQSADEFAGAVAPMGTALTEAQLLRLWRLLPAEGPREPVLCFDGDLAGLRAAARAVETALPHLAPGRSLRFVRLPEGEDPDSVVRKRGAEGFAGLLGTAGPLAGTLWEIAALDAKLERPRPVDTPEAKAALQAWLQERTDRIADDAVRAAYRDDLAGRAKAALGWKPRLVEATRKAAPGGAGGGGGAPAEVPAEGCPIVVLGVTGKVYAYLKRRGDYFELAVREHTDTGIAALFGGDRAWLTATFPAYGRSGQPVGVDHGAARDWLFAQAERLPPFDPQQALRGPGLWPDGDGGVIVHCGDEVLAAGRWRAAGCRVGAHVYPLEAALPAPAAEPGPVTDWQDLQDLLESWSWRNPARAVLAVTGWIANGMLAGVVPWHCPLYTTGESGAGKSALLRLFRAAFGPGWAAAVSAPSEAAVRQALGPSARPVLVDEIENDESGSKARSVAELVRLATDPEQAATARGSPEGTVRSYPVRAVLYFTGVLRPALQQQDLNRITILDMDPVAADVDAGRRLRDGIARAGQQSARMRARMLARWPAFHRVRDQFAAVLADQEQAGQRHKSRQLDQVGTLLTCAWLALSDDDPPPAVAQEWAALFPPDETSGVGNEVSDPWQCLQHLLTSSPERRWIQNANRRVTLAEMLHELRESPAAAPFELGAYGIGLWPHPDTGQKCLVVANHHLGLEEIYAGTRWARGVWTQSLGRLPYARPAKKTLSFKGSKQRGVWLPLDECVPDGRDAREPGEDSAMWG